MHLLERGEWVDEAGNPYSGVVTAVRVATIKQISAEIGEQRVNRIMTVFRDRFGEIWDGHAG